MANNNNNTSNDNLRISVMARCDRARIEMLENAVLTLGSRIESLENWGYQRRVRPFRPRWPTLASYRLNRIARRRNEVVRRRDEEIRRVASHATGNDLIVDEIDQEEEIQDRMRNMLYENREIQNGLMELSENDYSWNVPPTWLEIVERDETVQEREEAFRLPPGFNRCMGELCLPLGCAVVVKVGSGIEDLKCGDFVIPANAGLGTWCTHGIYDHSQIFPVDKNLNIIAASTLQVNPSTAYRMLHDFVALSKGDSVVQNGANSAVGRYVIQICRILGLKSHNIVRNGPNVDSLKRDLDELGADAVYTEEEFSDILRTNKLEAKLALNCVGGRSSLQLFRALGSEGQMITYGGMSQQPVQLPTTSLIFQNVTARGFWMSRWYEEKENIQERKRMYEKIGNWYKNGELVLPPHKKWRLEQFKEAIEEATKSTHPQGAKRLKHIFVADEE